MHTSTQAIKDYTDFALNLAFEAVTEGNNAATNTHIKKVASRIMLGKAMHTIQDFYAHSNFSDVYPDRDYFSPITDFLDGKTSVGTGLFDLMTGVYGKDYRLRVGNREEYTGGQKTGDACLARTINKPLNYYVTPSSFSNGDGNYQYTNMVKNGKIISTGYWWQDSNLGTVVREDGAAPDTPGFIRCDHGADAADAQSVSGIAKDAPFMPFAPGYNATSLESSPTGLTSSNYGSKQKAEDGATIAFKRASYNAAFHTKIYLESVVNYIRFIKPGWSADQREKVIAALFGMDVRYNRMLGFVVDVSGTMKDVLPTIKNSIKLKIAAESLNPLSSLGFGYDSFALITVKNPTIGQAHIGTADEISALVDMLEAIGGTGCEVPWDRAVDKMLDAFIGGGSIMLWTDSKSTSDADSSALIERLKSRGSSVGTKVAFQPIVSGSCSPIDPALLTAAQVTGQQAAIVDHSAGGFSIDIAPATSITDGFQYPLLASGTLGSPRTLNIPIDTGVRHLQVAVKNNGATVVLKNPSGAIVTTSAVTDSALLYSGSHYSVTDPATGIWQLQLSGTGAFEVTAEVDSKLTLATPTFETVLEVGRYGHEYGISLGTIPPAGTSRVTVILNEPRPNAQLEFLDLDGNVLGTYPLIAANRAIYQATVTVPTVAYRMRVSGTDVEGQAYARMVPTLSLDTPATLKMRNVVAQVVALQWKLGQDNLFVVNLKNFGATQSVTIKGLLSQQGFLVSCNPSNVVTLQAGAEQAVQCKLRLPDSTLEKNLLLDIVTAVGTERLTIPLETLQQPATDIPTLSEWAMLILLSVLLGMGGWMLRWRELR